MSQHLDPNTTQSSTSQLQSEISHLRYYINHVRHAMLAAPDDYTRMLRTWVLALAEAELARLNRMMESQTESSKSEDVSTSASPTPPASPSPAPSQPVAGPIKLSSPALTNPAF